MDSVSRQIKTKWLNKVFFIIPIFSIGPFFGWVGRSAMIKIDQPWPNVVESTVELRCYLNFLVTHHATACFPLPGYVTAVSTVMFSVHLAFVP